MFKRSGAGLLDGNSPRGNGKRLGTDGGKRALLYHAARRASRRKKRRPFLSKEGVLGKDGEPRKPQGVLVKGGGRSQMSSNTSERADTNEVPGGAVLATISKGAIGPDGNFREQTV